MMNKKQDFLEALNEMWFAFCAVVDVEKYPLYIEKFIEAKDRAHGLLSDLAKEEMELCTEVMGECSACDKCPICGEEMEGY